MPPKDYRTLGEDLVNVALRLPASIIRAIDAHVETLRGANRWAKVGRSDALTGPGLAGAGQCHHATGPGSRTAPCRRDHHRAPVSPTPARRRKRQVAPVV